MEASVSITRNNMDSLYKRRIADKLCGSCGKEPIDPSSESLGIICLKKSAASAAARRERNRKAGKCIGCGKKKKLSAGGKCETCLAKTAESAGRARKRKDDDKMCVACPFNDLQPAKPGCKLCQKHIDERSAVSSEHYRRRKNTPGMCHFCDHDAVVGESMCRYHKEQHADYRMQLKMEVLEAGETKKSGLAPGQAG